MVLRQLHLVVVCLCSVGVIFIIIKETIHMVDFLPFFTREANFVAYACILILKDPSEKWSALKGKFTHKEGKTYYTLPPPPLHPPTPQTHNCVCRGILFSCKAPTPVLFSCKVPPPPPPTNNCVCRGILFSCCWSFSYVLVSEQGVSNKHCLLTFLVVFFCFVFLCVFFFFVCFCVCVCVCV